MEAATEAIDVTTGKMPSFFLEETDVIPRESVLQNHMIAQEP